MKRAVIVLALLSAGCASSWRVITVTTPPATLCIESQAGHCARMCAAPDRDPPTTADGPGMYAGSMCHVEGASAVCTCFWVPKLPDPTP